jgi:hypothetical protein
MAVMLTDRIARDRGGCPCCIDYARRDLKPKLRRKTRRTEKQTVRQLDPRDA